MESRKNMLIRSKEGFSLAGKSYPVRRLIVSWNQVDHGLAARHAADVLGDEPRAAFHGLFRPARDVRGHEHVGQLVERVPRRKCRLASGGIAIPHVERSARDRSAPKRLVERVLV